MSLPRVYVESIITANKFGIESLVILPPGRGVVCDLAIPCGGIWPHLSLSQRVERLAAMLREAIADEPDTIERIEAHPSGFVNITFTNGFLWRTLPEIIAPVETLHATSPPPATYGAPPPLPTIQRLQGIARHAVSEGIIFDADAPLPPNPHPLEIDLLRQIVAVGGMIVGRYGGVGGRGGDVACNVSTGTGTRPLFPPSMIVRLAAAADRFYYGCRVVAAAVDVRPARMRLLCAAILVLQTLVESNVSGVSLPPANSTRP